MLLNLFVHAFKLCMLCPLGDERSANGHEVVGLNYVGCFPEAA